MNEYCNEFEPSVDIGSGTDKYILDHHFRFCCTNLTNLSWKTAELKSELWSYFVNSKLPTWNTI